MTSNKKSILVVDDDEPIRSMLYYMLNDHGYDVETASDGSEGLRKACDTRFDVIVLDNMMPGMSGEHLANRLFLLGCSERSRIIMITGGLVPPQSANFARVVLKKPFDIDDLIEAIEKSFSSR